MESPACYFAKLQTLSAHQPFWEQDAWHALLGKLPGIELSYLKLMWCSYVACRVHRSSLS